MSVSAKNAQHRHHPVVLVEGKVRKRCEEIERETVALREKLVSLRDKFEAERHAHLRELDSATAATKAAEEQIAQARIDTRIAIAVRDEQTGGMASLLSDFRLLDGKRAALSQRVATSEAAILTLRGRLEEATNTLAELDKSCAEESKTSAEHDWETVADLDCMKDSRTAAERQLLATQNEIEAERTHLEKILARAQKVLSDTEATLAKEEEDLEKKRTKIDDVLAKRDAQHRQKMLVAAHEKSVLSAKLEKIALLNQKLQTRLDSEMGMSSSFGGFKSVS